MHKWRNPLFSHAIESILMKGVGILQESVREGRNKRQDIDDNTARSGLLFGEPDQNDSTQAEWDYKQPGSTDFGWFNEGDSEHDSSEWSTRGDQSGSNERHRPYDGQ